MKPVEMNSDIEKITQCDSGFRLGCPKCTGHFIDERTLKMHLEDVHDLTFNDVSSGNIGDSDFKDGGTVY